MSREETFVDELPETIDCVGGCGGQMTNRRGIYCCTSCQDTATASTVRQRQENKQVVAA